MSSAQLRENQFLRKDSGFPIKDIDFLWWSIKQRSEWNAKILVKKSPKQERSTTVKLGSKVHDTKDMLDGRISCRLTFVTLVNFQSLIQWLLKCLTLKRNLEKCWNVSNHNFDQHSTAESVWKTQSDMIYVRHICKCCCIWPT